MESFAVNQKQRELGYNATSDGGRWRGKEKPEEWNISLCDTNSQRDY